ncbi:MAG TPA: hypothetical protein VGQ21_04460 [Thermoanaerobaculia bacterium]|jgi:hypothetical protein|nr:hypothetical protein [Thermoanaerobaculia bacterium]
MIMNIAATVALVIVGLIFSISFVRFRMVQRRQMAEKMFADRYGTCVLCASQPFAHATWMLGMAVASREPNRVSELEQLVAQCDWDRASMIREFEGNEDEVEYVVIRCPTNDQVALKKILSPAELWSNDYMLEDILLTPDDQHRLDALANSKWSLLQAFRP